MTIKRSHKLVKSKKEISMDEISSNSKWIGDREECKKDTIKEEEEFVEGPNHFLDLKK